MGAKLSNPFSSANFPRASSAHGQYGHHVAVKSSPTGQRVAPHAATAPAMSIITVTIRIHTPFLVVVY
mgnify:CR=1 FL=1